MAEGHHNSPASAACSSRGTGPLSGSLQLKPASSLTSSGRPQQSLWRMKLLVGMLDNRFLR